MKHKQPVRIIAFYLPQYHPIPENDQWWGKGFTEWINVGKAKPLFRGHDQPRIPADLGYYDLRLPETRKAQAEMAEEYGVEGFCYWHYWFGNGRQLLQRPFHEVLTSGEPDFPFCLSWANRSWKDKQFRRGGNDMMLMEQLYPGEEDNTLHFQALLPAFNDPRYIRVDQKPVFMIYSPFDIPDIAKFMAQWQKLAREQGLEGIHFIGHTYKVQHISKLIELGFDGVNIVRLFDFFDKDYSLPEKVLMKMKRILFKRGDIVEYGRASAFFSGEEDRGEECYPTIIPNWDHSPRSGRNGHILVHSTPAKFKKHLLTSFKNIIHKSLDKRLVFLKSWNEWAEGNYMEPDLKFGRGYLEALREALEEIRSKERDPNFP